MKRSKGLYIHVPFCAQRCIYCDFYSTLQIQKYETLYVQALLEELKLYRGCELHSVYFGGGTPSLLSNVSLDSIFETINRYYTILPQAEITIECNPDDVSADKLNYFLGLGINRISLGVQTFHDDLLRILKRRHNEGEALRAIELCDKVGLNNVSIDLMYGLPNTTMKMWERDIDTAFSLPITHLSSYALIYEPGTVLYHMKEKQQVKEMSDELEEAMYLKLIDRAEQHGFLHYEISNFAKPGCAAVHNTGYWKGWEYIGCGPGAHSYDGNNRKSNRSSLKDYVESRGVPPHEIETLSEEEKYEELILTRMRLSEGLNLTEIPDKYQAYFLEKAKPYLDSNALQRHGQHISLTRKGLFVSNAIFSDLI